MAFKTAGTSSIEMGLLFCKNSDHITIDLNYNMIIYKCLFHSIEVGFSPLTNKHFIDWL